jgi:hypothetical protein
MVRGRRLWHSSGGGGSGGHRRGRRGPVAPEVKEEGERHSEMAGRQPRAVLTGEGIRWWHSRLISATAVTLQWSATDKRRWGEVGLAARSNGREKGEGEKMATVALGGFYRWHGGRGNRKQWGCPFGGRHAAEWSGGAARPD